MTKHQITTTVNGETRQGCVESRRLLIHYLRDDLGVTSPHVGCDSSQCGACTVLLDGRAVKSCTVFAVQTHGSEIATVDGLAGEEGLHPLQKAFREEHGLQCGYCTPGMVLSAYELLRKSPDPADEEIRHHLKGNFCRCTGYQNIVRAVRRAAGEISGLSGAGKPAPERGAAS